MRTLEWHPFGSGSAAIMVRTDTGARRRFAYVFIRQPYEMTLLGVGVSGKVNVRLAGAGFKDALPFDTFEEAKAFVESVFALESN